MKKRLKFIGLPVLAIILNLFFCCPSFSQQSVQATDSSTKPNQDSTAAGKKKEVEQIDFPDLLRKVFASKKKVSDSSKTTTHFALLPAAGYSLQTGFAVLLAANGTFYAFNNPVADSHISTLLTSLTYSQYNQVIFPVQTDCGPEADFITLFLTGGLWRIHPPPSASAARLP